MVRLLKGIFNTRHPVSYNDGALDITPEGLTTLQLRKKIMILMVSSSADRCSNLHI